jgi:hypothetical protein
MYTLRPELFPGVVVNSLHPGVVGTNFMQHYTPTIQWLGSKFLKAFKVLILDIYTRSTVY